MHLSHLVRLERVRVLHLLAARLLADLPVHLRDTARGATATDEADGGVADLGFGTQISPISRRCEKAK